MKTDKLAKQIKKELTRNLKKTAALGLVTLVALWFWAPLLWKWVGGDPKKKARKEAVAAAQANDAAQVAATATATADAAPKAAPVPKIVWNELLARIADDENMATATLSPNTRDPFRVTAVEEQVIVTAPPVEGTAAAATRTAAIQDPTPESVGLTLEATFVSRQARRATINGKTYRIGQNVEITPRDPAAVGDSSATTAKPLSYEVAAIEARRVVLTREGREFALVLKRQSLTEDEQLSFGAPPQPPAQQ